MGNTLGNGQNGNSANKQEEMTAARPWKFAWKEFFIYGAIWLCIFFAIVLVQKAVNTYFEQQRQIQELINRQNQNQFDPPRPDWDHNNPFDRRGDSLSAWVKKNLPKTATTDERNAVADAFDDVAKMLEDGSLISKSDAFAEMIAQIQPSVERKKWMAFFTQLTFRLANLAEDDPSEIIENFREAASAIRPRRKQARETAVAPPPTTKNAETKEDVSQDSVNQNQDQVVKEDSDAAQKTEESASEKKTIPTASSVSSYSSLQNGVRRQ